MLGVVIVMTTPSIGVPSGPVTLPVRRPCVPANAAPASANAVRAIAIFFMFPPRSRAREAPAFPSAILWRREASGPGGSPLSRRKLPQDLGDRVVAPHRKDMTAAREPGDSESELPRDRETLFLFGLRTARGGPFHPLLNALRHDDARDLVREEEGLSPGSQRKETDENGNDARLLARKKVLENREVEDRLRLSESGARLHFGAQFRELEVPVQGRGVGGAPDREGRRRADRVSREIRPLVQPLG